MFSSIFTKTLWERRKSIFFWSMGIFAYCLMMGLLYPSIEGIEGFEALVTEMPDAVKAFIGEVDDITSPVGFLGAELFNLMLPLVLSILAIGIGASAIAKEEDDGTIELLLSTTTSRGRVILEKALALSVNVGVVMLAGWVGIALSTVMVDFDVNLVHVLRTAIATVLLALSFGLLALMITALGGKRSLAIGIATVVFVASYFADTLAVLVEELEFIRNFSLLYYYDSQSIIEGGELFGSVFVLSVVSVMALAGAFLGFIRRDIAS